MTLDEFNRLAAQGYNRIPVTLTLLADFDSPLSVYLKLADQPYTYLLESVVGGERFGRYSYIGLPCSTRIRAQGNNVSVEHNGKIIERFHGNPLDFIEPFLQRYRTAPIDNLPHFAGGLVGYFGYETVNHIEERLANHDKEDTLATPDILLMLSEELAVIDTLSSKLHLIVYADPNTEHALAHAEARIAELRQRLRTPVRLPLSSTSAVVQTPTAEWSQTAFEDAVRTSKAFILAGDIMQVVLSQRMNLPFAETPISFYRALRHINPSPYLFYYHFGDFHVVGSSPEILVRREQNTVLVRPIAGTRPRGKSKDEYRQLEEELLSDPKEKAEHMMLVDLGSNDLGRIANIGSVRISELMTVERYSHVMHIVSSIEATATERLSNIAILKATFPAGTLSGAPKIRAMEIIAQLEPTKRGIYGGAVGYLSFSGNMDLAIAIRTAVIKNNTLFVQAGAGIVADSDPSREWEETQNKAKAIIRAAHEVQSGLDA